ncbi:MAG: aldehyde dehydrogenase family protein, partial [Acidimicrobiales bacterium]
MDKIHHLVGGVIVEGTSGNTSPVFNPATGQQSAELSLASIAEVDAAVADSVKAFESWRESSLAIRTRLMFNFRDLVNRNADEIARRLTAEHGKVKSDALGELARGLENIEYACGIAEMLKGSYNEQASTGVDVFTVRQPIGVCAGITPFNF